MRGPVSLRQVWLAPALLLLVIVIGLIAALIGGRRFQVLTWIAMAIPLVLIARFWLRSRSNDRS